MNIINTTAPISIEDLKKYFADETIQFNIDYKNSTLKGSKLLIYLGNLNVPCDLDLESNDEFLDLVKDYFNAKTLVTIPKIEIAAVEIMLGRKSFLGNDYNGVLTADQVATFIDNNKEIVDRWMSVLDSMTLFNMKTIDIPDCQEFVESFPPNDTDDLTGINFVNVLKYPDFYTYYARLEENTLINYRRYFSEYMFKGKNLFHYWAVDANPMFIITTSIATGELKGGDIDRAIEETLKDFETQSAD
jgi:hypothetical protein